MAQEEHDAREGKEEEVTPPATPQATEAAPKQDSIADVSTTGESTPGLVPDAAPETEATPDLHLANDDGTDAIEIDQMVSARENDPMPDSDDMAATESLAAMPEENPTAISGAADEDPQLLAEAYELAEAAADHGTSSRTENPAEPLAIEEEAGSEALALDSATENAVSFAETPDSAEPVASEVQAEPNTSEVDSAAETTAAVTEPQDSDDDDRDDEKTTGSDEDEDDADESDEAEEVDYSQASPAELIAALENELLALAAAGVGPARFKKADALVKEIRPLNDLAKRTAGDAAKEKYVVDNGSEEGFDYKQDDEIRRIDELIREIRAKRKEFFQNLDKSRDQNFTHKTELLQRLRELVDTDDSQEVGAADMKSSWEEFKRIQEEWKKAGNVSSPHNGTLWATYNALIDRYFSNRNIYFELKELDRKKNSELKVELCQKIEALVKTLPDRPMSRELLKEGNDIFEEYKHVGPAPREEQELLWGRFKESLDALYDARRGQNDEQKKSMAEVYEQKSKIYEAIVPYTTFASGSINEWNAKTKELITQQDAWQATKGPMPRQDGKELSKKFWAALKSFFSNKSEFFKQLEGKREVNLTAKTALVEEVEQILAAGEDTPANTNRVIELQKEWKDIGQVPEKFKNSIYARFKKACDAYFEQKRSKFKEQDSEFAKNLADKEALCVRIEAAIADPKDSSITELNGFKGEWAKIGFVPRKAMQSIQKRYIKAINGYLGAIGKLSPREKEQAVLASEVEMVRDGDSSRNLNRKESDIRRKVTQLENDIALWGNNIEFFAKSKSADKVKAQFEEKIKKASDELEKLKHQLNIIQEAI